MAVNFNKLHNGGEGEIIFIWNENKIELILGAGVIETLNDLLVSHTIRAQKNPVGINVALEKICDK